jgi:hypothetical protein
MDKLEELHLDAHDYRDSTEITTDVAIKFAEWVDNMGYKQVSNSFYKSLLDLNGKTSEELFKEFINNHYNQ